MNRDEALDLLAREIIEWPVFLPQCSGINVDGWMWYFPIDGDARLIEIIGEGLREEECDYIYKGDWLRARTKADQQMQDERMDNIARNGNNGDHYEDQSIENSDSGAHYRYEYKGIKLDPYRILDVYGITSAPQQHAIKKLLRAGDSVKGKEEDIKEVIDTLNRWLDMLAEDNEVVSDD